MKKIFISALVLIMASYALSAESSDMRNYITYPVKYFVGGEFESPEQQVLVQEIATHTYQRNVLVSANVGQRMVDSQTFDLKKFSQNKLIARSDAVISSISDEIHVKKGQKFFPVGEVIIDDNYYILLRGEKLGGILLTDAAGRVQNKIGTIYHDELLISKDYASINPKGLIIAPTETIRTDVSDLKQNFEIIFNGYRKGMFEITYIDADGKSQKYVYKQEPQNININGVRINITGIYPDRIEYMLPQ